MRRLSKYLIICFGLLLGSTSSSTGQEILMTRECFRIGTFGSELHQDGEKIDCETMFVCSVCVAEKRTYEFDTFNGVQYSKTPLIITRVADHDANSDGIIGFDDFGNFTAMFGREIAPNGRVIK